jgi:predicted anti-sigma-YlaC factor YlaD
MVKNGKRVAEPEPQHRLSLRGVLVAVVVLATTAMALAIVATWLWAAVYGILHGQKVSFDELSRWFFIFTLGALGIAAFTVGGVVVVRAKWNARGGNMEVRGRSDEWEAGIDPNSNQSNNRRKQRRSGDRSES